MFLLSIALIILANVDLLVLVGLIALLTPPGFGFALLGILLLGTMIGALLWTGLNYLVDDIKAWCAQEESLLTPLTEEDKQTAWLDKELSLLEDHASEQTMVLINEDEEQEMASMKIALNNMDKELTPNEEETRVDEGITQNAQSSAENAERLEKNAKSMTDLDALSDRIDREQEVIVNIVKDLVQRGKFTVLPGVDLESLSSSPLDDEKNRDKKTSPPFN